MSQNKFESGKVALEQHNLNQQNKMALYNFQFFTPFESMAINVTKAAIIAKPTTIWTIK